MLISGDYASLAQEAIEEERHAGDVYSWLRRVAESLLQPDRAPLRVELDWVNLPLAPMPSIERLEQMRKGPPYLVPNASRMMEAIRAGRPLPTGYRAPLAVW